MFLNFYKISKNVVQTPSSDLKIIAKNAILSTFQMTNAKKLSRG